MDGTHIRSHRPILVRWLIEGQVQMRKLIEGLKLEYFDLIDFFSIKTKLSNINSIVNYSVTLNNRFSFHETNNSNRKRILHMLRDEKHTKTQTNQLGLAQLTRILIFEIQGPKLKNNNGSRTLITIKLPYSSSYPTTKEVFRYRATKWKWNSSEERFYTIGKLLFPFLLCKDWEGI